MRFSLPFRLVALLVLWIAGLPVVLFSATVRGQEKKPAAPPVYSEIVLADQPIAYWRMNADGRRLANAVAADAMLSGEMSAEVTSDDRGPKPPEFPLFGKANPSLRFAARKGLVRVDDPGPESPLDFAAGDAMTLEAWVEPEPIPGGQFAYVIGKGRTQNPGQPVNNQNYALRLKGVGGGAAITFLFRSAAGDDQPEQWHRWTSDTVMGAGDGWHHVALVYKFGSVDSLRGYIDGKVVKGRWDMGGKTDRGPVVDDDQLWIGSSMGGQAGSTFSGRIDEVAIYRTALSAERIAARYHYVSPRIVLDPSRIPDQGVLVDLYEGIADKADWNFRPPTAPPDSYIAPTFTFLEVPKKYSSRGVQLDRTNPFLLQAIGHVTLPPGTHRLLVRCRNACRVYLDDRQVLATDFHRINGNAHGKVWELDDTLTPHIRPLRRGDTQNEAMITSDGGTHLLRLEMIVGGRSHRPELGETGLFIATGDGEFRQLGNQPLSLTLTNADWLSIEQSHRQWLGRLNADRRAAAGKDETRYWQQRHQFARQWLARTAVPSVPPRDNDPAPPNDTVHNDIDRFVNARLQQADPDQRPAPLVGDLAFLRRVTLDVTGLLPSPEQIARFLQDPPQKRRELAIDRLLADPSWADQWMGYWQDVLAENPNIVNPTLNNTGPFRWWLLESLRDNKPFDRMVTELVMMEGSAYYGGPAGFGMATQNDAPLAAKAHILGQAFLGLNLQCARCHDAPFHPYRQEDLFAFAAMLNRSAQKVPATSTIPGGAPSSGLVEVTLKPGSSVAPRWPFEPLIDKQSEQSLPDWVLRRKQDSRERLAVLMTSPQNQRFAQVIVNRLWHRYLGHPLVDPVDDWHGVEPSHPQLLEYLARELVGHDYDLKHVARLILQSHVYQRQSQSPSSVPADGRYLFAAPVQRRMSAEQVVDSMIAVSGQPFDAGPMCIDIDSSRSYKQSLNLGVPRRSWQFASLSNERDRPSLALPFAQPFVTVLEVFGWRGARQNPVTHRDQEASPLQPAIIANGVLGRRVTRLTDESAFTQLALEDQPVEQLVRRVYLRVLTREPTAEERQLFTELLEPGYADRATGKPPAAKPKLPRDMVSWSNHLDPRRNRIKAELEAAVRQGDPPTPTLQSDWRQRMEDMLWALMNSPEFVFIP